MQSPKLCAKLPYLGAGRGHPSQGQRLSWSGYPAHRYIRTLALVKKKIVAEQLSSLLEPHQIARVLHAFQG